MVLRVLGSGLRVLREALFAAANASCSLQCLPMRSLERLVFFVFIMLVNHALRHTFPHHLVRHPLVAERAPHLDYISSRPFALPL